MNKPLPLQSASAGAAVAKPDWLPTLRSVVRAYQAFDAVSDAHIRTLGLTSPQFDIIVTLGNTAGMTCREVGERTLITKGTLTGVLDRLEAKNLLVREESADDRRSFIIRLTAKGQALFEAIFPIHLTHMDQYLGQLSQQDRTAIEQSLSRFKAVLRGPAPGQS